MNTKSLVIAAIMAAAALSVIASPWRMLRTPVKLP